MMDDARLRSAYGAWLAHAGHATAPPVDPAEIAALVGREGSEDARLALLDLVLQDPGTAREFALLQTARSASGVARGRPAAAPQRWLTAAALVLLCGVGAAAVWRVAVPANPLRGAGGGVMLTDEWTDRPLAWQVVPGAVQYRVEIVSPDGDAVQSVVTRDTSLARVQVGNLPADARWRVIARRLDGTSLSSPFRQLTTVRRVR